MVISYDSVVEFAELIQIKERWDRLKDHLRRLHPKDAMISLIMGELYCSWLDIEDVLERIEGWMNFTIGVQAAYLRTIELIEVNLQNGCPTQDLDIDALIPTPGIKLVPEILECRKREVESAEIFFTSASNRVNVSRLKRTFYGMKLMRELQFTKFTRCVSQEDYQKLKLAMKRLSLKIQAPEKK